MPPSRSRVVAVGVLAAAATVLALKALNKASKSDANKQSEASNGESPEAREERLATKFDAQDGVTFYFFPRSPCARRVWLTLLEKKIKFRPVMVNLLAGEQRSEAYLAVNPQGKVPAIQVRGVKGLPDCILYESQAIVEWCDEVPWPSHCLLHDNGNGDAPVPPGPLPTEKAQLLYPASPELRLEVKLWQYWELCLAEEFWPLSRQQVDGVIWRWLYSRNQFEAKLKEWSNGGDDAFYEQKARAMYNGTFLSPFQVRKRLLRILKGFTMLENALIDHENENGHGATTAAAAATSPWLAGGHFSQADIAVYPRLVKAPQNGILSTSAQRRRFPKALSLFSALAQRPAFAPFKWRDAVIWSSGTFPRFASVELGWWAWLLPWSLVVRVGNYRSGVPFERKTLDHFPDEVAQSLESASTVRAIPRNVAPVHEFVLYYSTELPMSCAVQMAMREMRLPGLHFRRVSTLTMDQCKPPLQQLTPFGELPVLVHQGRSIYGPHIILEYLKDVFPDNAMAQALLPSLPSMTTATNTTTTTTTTSASSTASSPSAEFATQRATVRKWFGWARTGHYYQVEHIWSILWWGPTLVDVYGSNEKNGSSKEALIAALPNNREGEAQAAIEAYEVASASASPSERLTKAAPYIEGLRDRLGSVEAALKETASGKSGHGFLCGPTCTYADFFVLPVVLLAMKYVRQLDQSRSSACGGPCGEAAYPLIEAWQARLFSRPGGHVASLCAEMVCLHGRPNIEYLSPGRDGYAYERVHGLVYDPFVRQECLDVLRKHWQCQSGDIFVATYPKAGTTWLQTVVLLLLHQGDSEQVDPHPALQKQAPWVDAAFLRGPVPRLAGPRPYLDTHTLFDGGDLNAPHAQVHPRAEMTSTAVASGRPKGEKRRAFKTHAPWHLFPCEPGNLHPSAKIVCIARNPKDVAVSLYKHTTAIPAHDYRGNWDAFLELFFKGHVCEGSWFDHTVGWWEASQKSAHKDQIFWIYFEDLKKDPAPVITALAAFLGVACDAKVLSKVMHASSFETMAESTAAQGNASAEAKSRFANGGHSGRWRKHFSEAQNAAMDALYAAKVNERTAPGLRFDFG